MKRLIGFACIGLLLMCNSLLAQGDWSWGKHKRLEIALLLQVNTEKDSNIRCIISSGIGGDWGGCNGPLDYRIRLRKQSKTVTINIPRHLSTVTVYDDLALGKTHIESHWIDDQHFVAHYQRALNGWRFRYYILNDKARDATGNLMPRS